MGFIEKIIIDLGEQSVFLTEIRKMKIEIPLYEKEYNKSILNILQNCYDGSIVKMGHIFWCSIEEEISKLRYNKDITTVFIEYIDRGVGDWKDLERLLRTKFPNLRNISVSQNFGKDNLLDTTFDLIIMNTMQYYEYNYEDVIYMKEVSDGSEYDPIVYRIIVLQVNGKIQVIITDELD